MTDPYRAPAAVEKEIEGMDENTKATITTKYLFFGATMWACLAASTCSYMAHEDSRAKVEIETRKVEAAKADRDRAMFEAMSRAAQAPK